MIELNEDRHLHNIAVLMKPDGSFDYCQLFDQGAGLLSDTTLDYPMDMDPITMIDEVNGKTLCDSFDAALDAAEKLYGQHLCFHFKKNDVSNLLHNEMVYDDVTKNRVETIILEQMRKYMYLFK